MKILLDILNRFNIEGIFPTDEELQQIVDEWKNYDETIEVELDFII